MFSRLLVRLWMGLLATLAWVAILLDNATTSFCLTIPCCPDFKLIEGNPITRLAIDLWGLEQAMLIGSLLGLLVILWVYDRVVSHPSRRSILLGSLALILLILIRGWAGWNNWAIYTKVFLEGSP